jgi:hypothetical protein
LSGEEYDDNAKTTFRTEEYPDLEMLKIQTPFEDADLSSFFFCGGSNSLSFRRVSFLGF